MKLNLMANLNKVTTTVSKHSPLILTVGAVVGLGATAVLAYKAAQKVEAITDDLEEARERAERKQMMDETIDNGDEHMLSPEDWEEYEDIKNDPEISRAKVVRDVAGAVALPVIVGGVSIACMLYSYKILNSRNGALAATVGTLIAEHKSYRERVRTVAGEDIYNQVEKPYDTKKGKAVNAEGVEEEVDFDEPLNRRSLFGEWFFNSDEYVSDDHMYNEQFVRNAIERIEVRLFAKGHIRLNEVYDALGMARTRSGELMGWSAGELLFDTQVTHPRTESGEFKMPEIYIKWTEPKYVYQNVHYGTENWGA